MSNAPTVPPPIDLSSALGIKDEPVGDDIAAVMLEAMADAGAHGFAAVRVAADGSVRRIPPEEFRAAWGVATLQPSDPAFPKPSRSKARKVDVESSKA